MPHKPASPCSAPGCPSRAAYRGRCSQHVVLHERERGSSAQRGYSGEWRRIRAAYLSEHPYCVSCGQLATEVDHVVPRAQGGGDEWENLRGLCKACHSRRTMAEMARG